MAVRVDPATSSDQVDEDYSSIGDDQHEVDALNLKVGLDVQKKNETTEFFSPQPPIAETRNSVDDRKQTSRSMMTQNPPKPVPTGVGLKSTLNSATAENFKDEPSRRARYGEQKKFSLVPFAKEKSNASNSNNTS